MRAALRSPMFWWAALVFVLVGCAETKTKIKRVDLKVNLKSCLGDANGNVQINGANVKTTCRSVLDENVPDTPVNACLVIVDTQSTDGAPFYVPMKWKGGNLTVTDPARAELELSVGHKIRAELLFFNDQATADSCGGAASVVPGGGSADQIECSAKNFCIFKMVQTSVNFAEGGSPIDFRTSGGACASAWNADLGSSLEICDEQDNDCDGLVDDGVQDAEGHVLGDTCTAGTPNSDCVRPGKYVCAAGAVTCDAKPGEPGIESCDGRDNDCDGVADDGAPNCCHRDDDPGCGLGKGICVLGVRSCDIKAGNTAGTWGDCMDPATSMPVPGPSTEVCDGLDNDCNDQKDEGFDLGTACSAGTGACTAQGTKICDANTGGSKCSAQPGMPAAQEVCDGIDNNCDGTSDEGFNLGAPCSVGVGACLTTVFVRARLFV